MRHAYGWFSFRVYRGREPLWLLLAKAAIQRLKMTPAGNRVFRRAVQWPLLRRPGAVLEK
jgi:hypothetical protein